MPQMLCKTLQTWLHTCICHHYTATHDIALQQQPVNKQHARNIFYIATEGCQE